MQGWLYLAAVLAVLIGAAHSRLGERYILVRLFRRDSIPHLFGGRAFTVNTLRFAWHVTTLAWWGFAAILLLIAADAASTTALLQVVAGTFLLTALVAAAGSRLRHLSWLVFGAIGVIALVAAMQ